MEVSMPQKIGEVMGGLGWQWGERVIGWGILVGMAHHLFAQQVLTTGGELGWLYGTLGAVVWANGRGGPWGGGVALGLLLVWGLGSLGLTGEWLKFGGAIAGINGLFLMARWEQERTASQLRASWRRERLLSQVAGKVRRSLEVGEILQTTVTEVRRLLQADQVYVALMTGEGHWTIKAAAGRKSLRDHQPDPDALQGFLAQLPAQRLVIHHPGQRSSLPAALSSYFDQFPIYALVAMPLMVGEDLLGKVVVYRVYKTQPWQKGDLRLLEQLSTQVAIAIQQAQWYDQVNQLNEGLAAQVAERTAQLQTQMAELQTLQKTKALFIQAISHDLRTSVMGLAMVLRSLAQQPQSDPVIARRVLDQLIQSGDRQLTLLNALAEDPSPGFLSLHRESIDLKDFLTAVQTRWQGPCDHHLVTLTLDIPPFPLTLHGDRHYLHQLMDNLMGNALTHNPPGLTLVLKAQWEKGTSQVKFTLKDTGRGMDPQQCADLFQLYLRNHHNQRLTGIGLGCYQSRQIVEAHGGQIGVHSTPGQGSQFWFTIPLVT